MQLQFSCPSNDVHLHKLLSARLPRACFSYLLWSFCCPHPIRFLYPKYLLKGVLFPHCPAFTCSPPHFLHHPRPFLNSGKTESSQVAKLQPTPVCTVQQALPSCFLPLCLALCLPPQFFHLGLPALRISVYPSPLQRMFSCHFAGSSLIHFLNLSSKVSSREAFSIPRASCTYSLCISAALAIPSVNSPFIVSHSRLSPYYMTCTQAGVNRVIYVLLYYADFDSSSF